MRTLIRSILVGAGVLVVALLPLPASAQTPPEPCVVGPGPTTPTIDTRSVPFGTPYTILADHDGLTCEGQPAMLTSARCLFDPNASTLTVPATIMMGTPITLTCIGPVLPIGTHTVIMGVSNIEGETWSAPHQFMVVVAPPPPSTGFCRYIKPGDTVVQTLAIGTHVRGTNQIATQATRWPILLAWGFKISADPRTTTPGVTVLIDAECVGLQP